jgi:oxygen-dependent protoporphyrinogen oxidase
MENCHDVLIVGAGLSGLSAAHFLQKLSPALDVVLLEKDSRPGGAVMSFKEKGFQGEWGPHGFLDNTPESQEILHDTGLYARCQQAPLGDFFRYVCHRGKLERLPQSLKTVFTTPLVPFFGKIRVVADLWKKPKEEDQTIGDWVAYRFGRHLLPLVDAAVTGSFAGDFNRLSIDAVMPGVRRLEKEAGSVLRGLVRKKKQGAASKKKMRLPAMLNFPQGMEKLIDTLAENRNIQLNTQVQEIGREGGAWVLGTDKGKLRGKSLLLALPVNAALRLLGHLKEPPAKEIPVSRIINVVMGFTDTAKIPYGFGYLAPERENRFTLGAMFTSHMFPDRAPKGHVLIEALVGGRRHPERLELSDQELIDKVYADVRQLIELPEQPVFTKVLRPKHGIPQLEMGHGKLQEWRQTLEEEFGGLYLSGFGWDGIGMNDMIKSAKKAAQALQAGGQTVQEEAKVKPVYF